MCGHFMACSSCFLVLVMCVVQPVWCKVAGLDETQRTTHALRYMCVCMCVSVYHVDVKGQYGVPHCRYLIQKKSARVRGTLGGTLGVGFLCGREKTEEKRCPNSDYLCDNTKTWIGFSRPFWQNFGFWERIDRSPVLCFADR